MKKIYITLLILATGLSLSAQNRDTKKADEHFDELEFVEAVEDYLKLEEKGKATPYVHKRLAESYYNLNDTKAAERYYALVVEQDNAEAEDHYRYAQMLKSNGKMEESQAAMEQFAQVAPDDERAVAFMKNPGYLEDIMGMQAGFTAEKMEVNSDLSDFGARVFNEKLYFVSARNHSRRDYGWNEQPTLDVYVSEKLADSYGEAELLTGDVNSKYHEGPVSITEDGTTMYFTRNDYVDGDYEADESGIGQLKILSAQWAGGEWTDVKALPFTDSEYSTGHPALSPDDKTLYFSSDMPGGMGQSDLYKVSINEDGSFGEPQNLGANINTVGKESFPFVDSDGTLYFSSDGHLGMGGLDVFKATAEADGFSTVENMGAPVNSSSDDFAYSQYQGGEQAFVSSDRGSAPGNDDIYLLKPMECANDVLVSVVDADTKQPIAGASAKVYAPGGKFVASETASPSGEVNFSQPCGKYEVQADAEGYFSNSVTVEITKEDKDIVIELQLPPEPEITETEVVLKPIYFEFDKSDITPEAALELDRLVRVMQEHPEMKIQVGAHTDSRGSDSYNLDLSDRRAKSTAAYIVSQGIDTGRITGQGFGETQPKIDCGNTCTEEEYAANRRSEFRAVKK